MRYELYTEYEVFGASKTITFQRIREIQRGVCPQTVALHDSFRDNMVANTDSFDTLDQMLVADRAGRKRGGRFLCAQIVQQIQILKRSKS
jgi:hypothetical protein